MRGGGVRIPTHETSAVVNADKVYEDGSTITKNGDAAVIATGDGKTTSIEITSGKLDITSNSWTTVTGIKGTVTFTGAEVNLYNQGSNDTWSYGVDAQGGGLVKFDNEKTSIYGDKQGMEAWEEGSKILVEKDLDINIDSDDSDVHYGMIISNGGTIETKGTTNIKITGGEDSDQAFGINLWGNDVGGTGIFNTTNIEINGGWRNFGIVASPGGAASSLTFKGQTNIIVQDGSSDNTGIQINSGSKAEFNGLNIKASGGNSNWGITMEDSDSLGTFKGLTNIYIANGTEVNTGMLVGENATAEMDKLQITTEGGKSGTGLQVIGKMKLKDALNVSVTGTTEESGGLNIIEGGDLSAGDVKIKATGTMTNFGLALYKAQAALIGHLAIEASGGTANTGLQAAGDAVFSGTTGSIITDGTNGVALKADRGGKITFTKDVLVAGATAVYATVGGTHVDLQQGFENSGDSLITAINGAVVDINSSGTGTVAFKGTTAVSHDNNSREDGIVNLNLHNAASSWSVTGSSTLTDLTSNKALVDMTADQGKYSTLTMKNLTGTGGLFKQDIDVRTMESDKIFVTGDFNGQQYIDIYQKDDYLPPIGGSEGVGLVLASVNGDGTFTALDREGSLFNTHYDLGKQQSNTSGFETDWYLKGQDITNETTSVDTIMSAGALTYNTWRAENDKLRQRMGELRYDGEKAQGVWFRMYGTKLGRSGHYGFENKATTYELGYDTKVKQDAESTSYEGLAFGYTDGSGTYKRGSGENTSKNFSFYKTDLGAKGHYLDLIFKVSSMDNDFSVYDTKNQKITGDFSNVGVSVSAEYGRKNDLSRDWYFEPQTQLVLGYLGGTDYTTGNGIRVEQDGETSLVARAGFNLGKNLGDKGTIYAKVNLLHDFGGGLTTRMRDTSGDITLSESFRDTWLEYGVGAAFATGSDSSVYFDVERSTGSDYKKDWQWNVGARWTF